jgi:hypothetical protein
MIGYFTGDFAGPDYSSLWLVVAAALMATLAVAPLVVITYVRWIREMNMDPAPQTDPHTSAWGD